jgi:hypothetical protein
MQPTSLGPNLTGAAVSPSAVQAMTQVADALTPFDDIDTSDMEAQKLAFIAEAEAVGSVPVPASMRGVAKGGVARLEGGQPTILLDKLGERLAYERTGTRLYQALILKYRAAQELAGDVLPPAGEVLADDAAGDVRARAGRERDDDADRLARVLLLLRKRREGERSGRDSEDGLHRHPKVGMWKPGAGVSWCGQREVTTLVRV